MRINFNDPKTKNLIIGSVIALVVLNILITFMVKRHANKAYVPPMYLVERPNYVVDDQPKPRAPIYYRNRMFKILVDTPTGRYLGISSDANADIILTTRESAVIWKADNFDHLFTNVNGTDFMVAYNSGMSPQLIPYQLSEADSAYAVSSFRSQLPLTSSSVLEPAYNTGPSTGFMLVNKSENGAMSFTSGIKGGPIKVGMENVIYIETVSHESQDHPFD